MVSRRKRRRQCRPTNDVKTPDSKTDLVCPPLRSRKCLNLNSCRKPLFESEDIDDIESSSPPSSSFIMKTPIKTPLRSDDDDEMIPNSQAESVVQEEPNYVALPLKRKEKYKLPAKYRPILPTSARKIQSPIKSSSDVHCIQKSSFYRISNRDDDDNNNTTNPPIPSSIYSVHRVKKLSTTKKLNKRNRISKNRIYGFNKGVSHGIRKPKRKISINNNKKMISNSSLSKPTIPSKLASQTPSSLSKIKSGSLNVTDQTKISYEIKGGQLVFRKIRKNSESIRNYPSSSCRKSTDGENSLSSTKLFSPSTNFLNPSSIPSPNKFRNGYTIIPSPVKFHSEDHDHHSEVRVDVTDIIQDLKDDDDDEDEDEEDPISSIQSSSQTVYVTDEELNRIAVETEEQIRGLNLFHETNDERDIMQQNICDILSSIPQTLPGMTPIKNSSSDYLSDSPRRSHFPIFDKSTANSGLEDPISLPVQIRKMPKKFVSTTDSIQTVIDAGQKRIGAHYCLECSVVYTIGDPDDERHHEKIHNGFLDIVKFTRWKDERVVRHLPEIGRRIIMVNISTAKYWEKSKVVSVLSVVDKTIGSVTNLDRLRDPKAFLYIADKMVVGLLLAERITRAYPVNTNDVETTYDTSVVVDDVKCGVSRIWVMSQYRRQGVATKLIDTMRENYFETSPLCFIKRRQIAFSQTTPDGTDFASAYCKDNRHDPCSKYFVYLPES